MFATGYFGVPGSSRGDFTVHVIGTNGPLCGWVRNWIESQIIKVSDG